MTARDTEDEFGSCDICGVRVEKMPVLGIPDVCGACLGKDFTAEMHRGTTLDEWANGGVET